MDNEYLIELLNISKSFPGVKANDNITLRLKKGEIHSLLGENGSGKSTFLSILFGLYQPDEGEIRINGKKVQIDNPRIANSYGIGMVHQHFKLVECFTVLENIILGVETTKYGFLCYEQAREKIKRLSELYELDVDCDARIEDISVGMQQRTEILKMLYRDCNILIFDEPTAMLSPQESSQLMVILRRLAAEGKSILFTSHKLQELMCLSDFITVIRKGKYIGTVRPKDVTEKDLSRMMVGREVDLNIRKKTPVLGEVVLKVENCSVASKVHPLKKAVDNVSFFVRQGEIVGIAGIDGNGQSELIHAITGLIPLESGSIFLNGKEVTHSSVRSRNTHGMSHIPEDRHKHGLVLDFSLGNNLILQRYFEPQFKEHGFFKPYSIYSFSEKLIEEFDIRSGNRSKTITRSMSGGNQQKAIVAREIEKKHNILIAVQPTRGVDIGAIELIQKRLVEERDSGKAVLLVSLELDEIFSLSDRILVMYKGAIVGEFLPSEIDRTELGLYMIGGKKGK